MERRWNADGTQMERGWNADPKKYDISCLIEGPGSLDLIIAFNFDPNPGNIPEPLQKN